MLVQLASSWASTAWSAITMVWHSSREALLLAAARQEAGARVAEDRALARQTSSSV
ncbi:hypothetical protein [Deinococcus metallilatus]|uniref:Uncharacterized protein n=1 Tax=Deinococcus metallilatus TaxID=1211322 RepID=A0ABR6MNB8_9DEIO|nr:hypothetical protein [Deinococcus metallilatus]MBB5293434.1 hypothetical protein [Deinococcus metallilatus]GMA15346.1 hypothetical protein GCM10025871_16770 [Deinococcus metallilatus]